LAQIEIISECERPSGWVFDAQVLDDAGRLSRHRVAVSWADYNLWSPTGADAPQAVAAAVLRFLSQRRPAQQLAESFDASIARRLYADADETIPRLIA
jgi:hypothetical protein